MPILPESIKLATPPQFPLKPELLIQIFYAVLVAVFVTAVPLMLAGKWFPSTLLMLTELPLFAGLMAVRRGHTKLAAWLILAPLSTCVAILLVVGKGPVDESVLALPALMIFASLFVSRTAYVGMVIVITLLLATVGVFHFNRWFVISPFRLWYDTFFTVIVILCVTSYYIWLMATSLRSTMAELETENERVRTSLAQIEVLAHHDALTGLPNRILARDRFLRAATHAARNQTSAALLYLDIDNFKTVNDSLGHDAGDALLCEIGARLVKAVRAEDTVSRQGGDEFLVVVGDITDEDAVASIAVNIVETLAKPFQINGLDVTATCSLGVAMYPGNGTDYETLRKQADLAMYQAKEAGRNAFRFFDEEMNTNVVEHLLLISAMRSALVNHEFQLHYQPQYSLADQRVVGAEALLRWQHPEMGLIPPARFIPLAERSGLIVEIGAWVLQQACLQAKAWQAAGLLDLVIAVNVSPVQLRRDGLEEAVQRALAQADLAAHNIGLELTETMLLADSRPLHERLARLRAMGLHLSIDDFGTGYSNLSYLKQFDVESLKIDQSFVRRMTHHKNDEGIVRAIVQIADSLQLESVAEGIEDAQTLQALIGLGCRYGQGFHWSPALPPGDFLKFVQKQA